MIVRKVRPNRSAIAASARRWSDASEAARALNTTFPLPRMVFTSVRSEEHTSELQSQSNPVCRLLLEIKRRFERFVHPHPRMAATIPRAPSAQMQRRHSPKGYPMACGIGEHVAAAKLCWKAGI